MSNFEKFSDVDSLVTKNKTIRATILQLRIRRDNALRNQFSPKNIRKYIIIFHYTCILIETNIKYKPLYGTTLSLYYIYHHQCQSDVEAESLRQHQDLPYVQQTCHSKTTKQKIRNHTLGINVYGFCTSLIQNLKHKVIVIFQIFYISTKKMISLSMHNSSFTVLKICLGFLPRFCVNPRPSSP